MDAFYAAIEQLDDPTLVGRPVLVGGRSPRSVVSTASYEARPFGVGSAMPMVEALRRCPEAVVIPPRFSRYKEISAKVMEVFSHFSPLVEPLSLDEAFLDMTGARRLFGRPEEIGRRIKKEVFRATGGLTISIGASTTKFVAKVASDEDKPDGLTIVPGPAVEAFLQPLPIGRLWGVGPKARTRLAGLGLHRIGDVANKPENWLVERLGSLGLHISRLARANDDRDVIPDRERKSISSERTLDKDVRGYTEIRPLVARAIKTVAHELRQKGFRAGGVRVKLKTASFEILTRQLKLAAPTDSTEELLQGAYELLELFDLDRPYRLVGAGSFDLTKESEPLQGELFPDPKKVKLRKIDSALDLLQERFGSDVVGRGEEYAQTSIDQGTRKDHHQGNDS